MPKDDNVASDVADETVNNTGTDKDDAVSVPPTEPAPPMLGTAGLDHYVPSPEERRQRALELATYGGSNEHKEPIKSVLARAEAYRLYVENGETGIVD